MFELSGKQWEEYCKCIQNASLGDIIEMQARPIDRPAYQTSGLLICKKQTKSYTLPWLLLSFPLEVSWVQPSLFQITKIYKRNYQQGQMI